MAMRRDKYIAPSVRSNIQTANLLTRLEKKSTSRRPHYEIMRTQGFILTNLSHYGVEELDLFVKNYQDYTELLITPSIHKMFKKVILNNHKQVCDTKVVLMCTFKKNQLFPNLEKLYNLVYCFAPTSVACERMFSRMNLIKNDL